MNGLGDPWNEIVPGLWMGGDDLPPHGFDHVVSLCEWGNLVSPGPDDQRCWFIDDADELPDLDELGELAADVADRVARGERVLVRCQAGLNRSGLVVAAALIERGHDAHDAVRLIREQRDEMALCNHTFEAYLLTEHRPA